MSDIKIIVATHKQYWMPDDEMYLPVYVGAEGKNLALDFAKDNTGENISKKNKNYCELTGLYWAWKNLDADYIGLVHYRRHFCVRTLCRDKKAKVISKEQVKVLLNESDILLPIPRNYIIETNYSHYEHAHHAVDLDTTRQILVEKYPEYLNVFDSHMKKTTSHMFNMFIMKKNIFEQYCEWLFDVLFELEKRLDITEYNENDSRVYGFVSELLLDVWIETNDYSYKNIPYVFMEKQNWLKKGMDFLLRKIGKKHG